MKDPQHFGCSVGEGALKGLLKLGAGHALTCHNCLGDLAGAAC